VAPDGAQAFVTSPDGPFLTVIDASSRTVARRIPLSGGPLGIAVHPSGRPVYVADWYGKRLLVVDPDEGRVEASAAVGASPSGVAAPRTGR
jgi:YVTN family beta-propeller protein